MTTSVTQGVSGIVSALDLARAAEDRDQRVRVPDRRPDRPRAGAARRGGRARAAGGRRVDPARALRRGDRRAHRARLLHDRLLPHRPPARRRRDRALAHEQGALCLADSYQAIGAIDFDARALGVDFVTGGTVKYLLGSFGPRLPLRPPRAARKLLPSQTGWFADEDIFRMDISDYSPAADARRFDAGTPPVPNIYAASPGCRSSRRPARPRSRSTSPASPPA